MITGGFTTPIEMMPKFVQVLAEMNPVYHDEPTIYRCMEWSTSI